jgi:renalase
MAVGIIGAGIAGLSCAAELEAAGIGCVLFDKGKRPGGRLSSLCLDAMAWDFGAQYLRPGSGPFSRQVASWRDEGLVAPWHAGPEGALVGVPSMASLVEAQCAGRDTRFNAHIHGIDRRANGWWIFGPGLDEGPFDAVVMAVPPVQAIPLLTLHDFPMARELIGVRSLPCWTAMVAFSMPLANVPAYLRNVGPIAWAARNSSKPGRPESECWVLQANAEWSIRNLEIERHEAATLLLEAFSEHSATDLPDAIFLKAHRWRFSQAFGERRQAAWNEALGLGVCGDWSHTSRIEGAWRSGRDLAERIIGSMPAAQGRVRAEIKA